MPNDINKLRNAVFRISNESEFLTFAMDLFRHQFNTVSVYREYCRFRNINLDAVKHLRDIPFLPISLFKTHKILSKSFDQCTVFKSSGTGNRAERSAHFIPDLSIYEEGLLTSFEHFVGKTGEFQFFSLLPGYEINKESSLIYMVEYLSKRSVSGQLQRYPGRPKALLRDLYEYETSGVQCIVFGVTYALLELAEMAEKSLKNVVVIETGGMKGMRKEITRTELHEILRLKLNPEKIISEYGMTELLSQAYSINSEWFEGMPWFKVLVRDINDPMHLSYDGSGALNIIDLANLHSCAFIATDDLGVVQKTGKFSVIGRFDHSDIRGCNLISTD